MNNNINLVIYLEKLALINKQNFAIFLIWLFHISAIVGVSMGHFHFFVPKTYLNLSVMFGLLYWVYPLFSVKKIALTLIFFFVGFLVEYLGVNYGLLFGDYSYGENLGFKFKNVPLLIGVNWAMLILITGAISNAFKISTFSKIMMGASLMILLDIPMETVAPIFDFWTFSGNVAPLQNYVAWFIVAAFLHSIFQFAKLKGNQTFSTHLYICQFVFFSYFFIYYYFS